MVFGFISLLSFEPIANICKEDGAAGSGEIINKCSKYWKSVNSFEANFLDDKAILDDSEFRK